MAGVESYFRKKQLGVVAALACLVPFDSASALVETPMHGKLAAPAEYGCAVDPYLRSGGMLPLSAPARQEKSAAILGGMSALELMRSEQVTFAQPQPEGATAQDMLQLASSLEPATGGHLAQREGCDANAGATMLARPGLNQLPAAAPRSGDFLQSRRVPIGSTRFDAQWQRVRHGSLNDRQLARAVGSSGQDHGEALLNRVNTWVNNNIRYVEDAQFWGSPDYWATASETLRRAGGDCEDLAIVKMKLLEQAGFHRDEMYLTVARDLYRNADHAFLVVKLEGQFYVLDNAIDRVLPANHDLGYRPVLSFSSHRSWLHGY